MSKPGRKAKSLLERFLAKINKTDTCWIWIDAPNDTGYGRLKVVGGKHVFAHRLSHTLFKGPIPKGLTIDHLCRNTMCVNPDHLEAVTSDENNRRSPFTVTSINRAKTHCKQGHPFDQSNTRYSNTGKRICIECFRRWDKNRYYTKRRKVNEH